MQHPYYSIFPPTIGTLKPEKKPYSNLSLPDLIEEARKSGHKFAPPEFYKTLHKFPHHLLEQDFEKHAGKDTAPIPATEDREMYHGDRHLEWWFSGLMTWLRIKDLAAQYGKPVLPGQTVLELGCATGRVLRHIIFQNPDLNVIGCDINARHIDWLQHFLPQMAQVFQNSAFPSLPLPDNSIDIGIACSVFTHIDDFESSWLMEIRRILKPGGLFFATIMSDGYWIRCGSHPAWSWVLDGLLRLQCDYGLTRQSFLAPMPDQRIVLGVPYAFYNTSIFHHRDYIYRVWSRYLKILEILDFPFDIQDLVILSK